MKKKAVKQDTIKIGQVVKAVDALRVICNEPLPILTTFKLKTILKQLEGTLETFNETKTDIIKRYGTLEENGDYTIPTENLAEADKLFQEVLDSELPITIEPIKLDEKTLENLRISANDLLLLDWLIVEPN